MKKLLKNLRDVFTKPAPSKAKEDTSLIPEFGVILKEFTIPTGPLTPTAPVQVVRSMVANIPPGEVPPHISEWLDKLESYSQSLVMDLIKVREEHLAKLQHISEPDRNFIVTQAATDMLASWFCNPDFVKTSTMDMNTAMSTAFDLLVNNFRNRQEHIITTMSSFKH